MKANQAPERKIKDIHKNIIKDGDRVYNRNVKKYGIMKYIKEGYKEKGVIFFSNWWYFFADDGKSFTGVPDFISESPDFGIEKYEVN